VKNRVAFINTRMPGMTFLARDLVSLIRSGVVVDLYLFDPADLDEGLRQLVRQSGGVVERIRFPLSGGILVALLREVLTHPLRLLQSFLIGLAVLLQSPAEGVRALGVLPASLLLGRIIRESGATRTHGLWAGVPTTVAYWISRHALVPFSFSGHAWDITGRTAMLGRKVAAARSVVVCSQFARNTVCALCPASLGEKVRLVHHGLDLSRWSFGRETPGGADGAPAPCILAVGRLTPKKGYEVLVEACGLLRESDVRFECRIIGPDAGVGPDLVRRIAENKLEEKVILAGELPEDEVLRWMKRADVLACPSVKTEAGDSDGIPNVVLEAMAVGLPVVSTDAGGLTEVVQQEITGLLVPQRDPAALAAALQRSLADRPAARRWAEQARRRLESSFETAATTRQMLQALGVAEILSGNQGGTRALAHL